MSVLLVEDHAPESGHDREPVDIVGDDGAVRGRVGPAQDRVEDAPSACAVAFLVATLRYPLAPQGQKRGCGRTNIDVPHAEPNVV
jgi:hypothetical protein